MKNHEYAIKLLGEKIEKLEKKKGEDKDLNDGLDALINHLRITIDELNGLPY